MATVFYVTNTTDDLIAVRDNHYVVLHLEPAGTPGDRKPVSSLVLERKDVQHHWQYGHIAVFADDDYETVVPFAADDERRRTLVDSKIAALLTDPDSVSGKGVKSVAEGGGSSVTWQTLAGVPEFLSGVTADAVRIALGAGTSSLTLGTGNSQAARGDHTHSQYAATGHTHTAAAIGAAPADHSHPVEDLSDASEVARTALKAATAQAFRDAIGAGTSSLALGTGNTQAARGDHSHAGLTADAAAGTASIRTLGTGAQQAAAGNHTHSQYASTGHSHTATQVTATAVGGGTATTVQGILEELATRLAALETPA